MDLDYPAEAEAFRLEVRAWLDENLPAGFSSASPDQRQALLADWNDKLIEVQTAVRAAWSTVGIADVVFDTWWETMARPFIDAYVREVKAADAWVPV